MMKTIHLYSIMEVEQMLSELVAKLRYHYHLNAIEINNVLNQLHIRDDLTAERKGKEHFYEILDCLDRLGYDVNGYIEKHSKDKEEP